MLRRRITFALLLLLAWSAASTWSVTANPPTGVVLASEEPERAPALRSRVAAGEQVTRLPRHDLPGAAIVNPQPPAIVAAVQRPAAVAHRLPQRRALARRIARAPDEPS